MSYLEETIEEMKNKGKITIRRLDESEVLEENNINIGITKYMEAVVTKYMKDMTKLATIDWESLEPEEREEFDGELKEYIVDFASDHNNVDRQVDKLTMAFNKALHKALREFLK